MLHADGQVYRSNAVVGRVMDLQVTGNRKWRRASEQKRYFGFVVDADNAPAGRDSVCLRSAFDDVGDLLCAHCVLCVTQDVTGSDVARVADRSNTKQQQVSRTIEVCRECVCVWGVITPWCAGLSCCDVCK